MLLSTTSCPDACPQWHRPGESSNSALLWVSSSAPAHEVGIMVALLWPRGWQHNLELFTGFWTLHFNSCSSCLCKKLQGKGMTSHFLVLVKETKEAAVLCQKHFQWQQSWLQKYLNRLWQQSTSVIFLNYGSWILWALYININWKSRVHSPLQELTLQKLQKVFHK